MKVVTCLVLSLVLVGCKGEEDTEVLPPSAPEVSVTPATATSAEDISVVIDQHSIDPAGLPVSYRYEWTSTGGGSAEGDTLSAASTARGEQWTVTVTPNNGELDGSPGEATAVIVNAPPALDGVSFNPSNPASDTDLTCVAGATSDNDGDVVSVLYRWSVNGSELSVPQSTLAATNFVRTDLVRCTVTPTDGFASGNTAFVEATIANGLPTLDVVTLGPVGATVSDDLLCVPGTATDPDGDGVTLSFAWTVAGSAVVEASATLTSGHFEKGQEVVCIVTPNDGANSGSSVPSNGLTIANSPPVVHSAIITPDPPRTLDLLECQYSASDPDTDFLSPRFTWKVNDVLQSEASSTLFPTDFVRGQDVLCTVTVNDGSVDSNTATSEEVEVENTPPVVTTVTLSPNPAYTNINVNCDTTDDDDDGDTVTLTYAWTVEGGAAGADASALAHTEFVKGNDVVCTVTPHDGIEPGSAVVSSALEISNSEPTLSAVDLSIAPAEDAYTNSTLSCIPVGDADADQDDVDFEYLWTVNGSPVTPTGDPDDLDGATDFDKGDVVVCTVTPDDGDGVETGASMTSDDLLILNFVPTKPRIDIDPGDPVEQVDDLECRVLDDSVDIDPGDTVTYTFEWTVGGTEYEGAITTTYAGDTVPFTDTHADEVWVCTVTPTADSVSGPSDVFSVTVGSESGGGLVIGLEAPSNCIVWNVGESYDDIRALLEGAGHTVVGISGTDIDTLAEIQAYDVIVLPSYCRSSTGGGDWATFDAVVEDYVLAGGGMVSSGWSLYDSSGIGTEMQTVLPTAKSVGGEAGYFDGGGQLVTPVPGHPITAGISAFTQTAKFLPYGGGTKAGATVLATSSETDVAAAWTYGLGRTVYLGPLYAGEYLNDENEELIDGTIPDATALFVQAIEWAGDYGWPSVPGFEGEYGPVVPGFEQCEGYLDMSGSEDIPAAWGDDCTGATHEYVAIACGTSTSSYRYILVDKNPFRDGIAGWPEYDRVYGEYDQDGTAFTLPSNAIQAVGSGHPHDGASWWGGGLGCGDSEGNLTVNNVCSMEAENCFGQNLSYSDRYLWVYVSEATVVAPREPYTVLQVDGYYAAEIKTSLEGWGYSVTTVDGTVLDGTFDYSPYDVVSFSQQTSIADFAHLSSVNVAGDIGIVLHSEETPTLTALDMGSTTSVYQVGSLTTLDGDHFITAPYGVDTFDLGWTYLTYVSAPSANVKVLGDCDSGAALGVHNTYRRVFTPFYGHPTGLPWNADGEEITRRSFRWAAGEGAQ